MGHELIIEKLAVWNPAPTAHMLCALGEEKQHTLPPIGISTTLYSSTHILVQMGESEANIKCFGTLESCLKAFSKGSTFTIGRKESSKSESLYFRVLSHHSEACRWRTWKQNGHICEITQLLCITLSIIRKQIIANYPHPITFLATAKTLWWLWCNIDLPAKDINILLRSKLKYT